MGLTDAATPRFRGNSQKNKNVPISPHSIQGATDKEKRDKAKAVNYGILFQMTAQGLSRELNTDRKTAHSYINAFWAK